LVLPYKACHTVSTEKILLYKRPSRSIIIIEGEKIMVKKKTPLPITLPETENEFPEVEESPFSPQPLEIASLSDEDFSSWAKTLDTPEIEEYIKETACSLVDSIKHTALWHWILGRWLVWIDDNKIFKRGQIGKLYKRLGVSEPWASKHRTFARGYTIDQVKAFPGESFNFNLAVEEASKNKDPNEQPKPDKPRPKPATKAPRERAIRDASVSIQPVSPGQFELRIETETLKERVSLSREQLEEIRNACDEALELADSCSPDPLP
jgi:hypothetical protein